MLPNAFFVFVLSLIPMVSGFEGASAVRRSSKPYRKPPKRSSRTATVTGG